MKQLYFKEEATNKVTKAEDIVTELNEMCLADQEIVVLIGMDGGNRMIKKEVVFMGGACECIMDPRIIFKRLLTWGASRFILAHNHPSGSINPSMHDINAHREIEKGAETLGLEFLDNLIISDTGHSSIKEVLL